MTVTITSASTPARQARLLRLAALTLERGGNPCGSEFLEQYEVTPVEIVALTANMAACMRLTAARLDTL